MIDEGDFLKAIADDPLNDQPRLVYADWLDESGQVDRADYIRTQCELAALPVWSSGRDELLERSNDLFDRHRNQWLKPIRGTGIRSYEFRRGFLHHVAMHAVTQWKFLPSLLDNVPTIQSLKVNRVNRNFDAFCNEPLLGRIRVLDLSGNKMGMRRAEQLSQSPYLGNVTTLDLDGNQVRLRGLQKILDSNALTRLKRLSLSNAGLQPNAQIGRAFQGRVARQLEWIDLTELGGNSNAIQYFEEFEMPQLRGLRFGDYHGTSQTDFSAFLNSKTFARLEYLSLHGHDWTRDALVELFNHPNSINLRWLELGWRPSVNLDLHAMQQAEPIWENLEYISFDGNRQNKMDYVGEIDRFRKLKCLGYLPTYGSVDKRNKELSQRLGIPVIIPWRQDTPGNLRNYC